MVQNCPRCGTANTTDSRFCANCGALISDSAPQSDAPTPETQNPGAFVVRTWDQGKETDTAPDDESTSVDGAEGYRPIRMEFRPMPLPASEDVIPPVDVMSPPLRADLPPNTAEKSGQATFVPYSDDAIEHLTKQGSSNAGLLRAIYIAGAVLVVLIVATIFLLLSNGKATPGSQVATSGVAPTAALEQMAFPSVVTLPCSLPAGASSEQAIIYTVCRSSEEQIEAWRNLDTEILKGSRTGADLLDNVQQVEKYKADKQYADSKLHKLTITSLKFDLGDAGRVGSAVVTTSEVWSVTTYSSVDKSVVEKMDPTAYNETYHLVKQNDKWFVDQVQIAKSGAPVD